MGVSSVFFHVKPPADTKLAKLDNGKYVFFFHDRDAESLSLCGTFDELYQLVDGMRAQLIAVEQFNKEVSDAKA